MQKCTPVFPRTTPPPQKKQEIYLLIEASEPCLNFLKKAAKQPGTRMSMLSLPHRWLTVTWQSGAH